PLHLRRLTAALYSLPHVARLHLAFFLSPRRPPPRSTLFPYTTLFRSSRAARRFRRPLPARRDPRAAGRPPGGSPRRPRRPPGSRDRKSTRLNSSHVSISYAVFCLKKKKNMRTRDPR